MIRMAVSTQPRIYSDINVSHFVNTIDDVDWSEVLEIEDVNNAFNT